MCGAAAGVAAPILLGVVLVALTLTERAFLRDVGWSPVKRTEVAWPSLLELSPRGWILQGAFIGAAVLGITFAVSWLRSTASSERIAAAALCLMSAAVAAMALPPDPPGSTTGSWHGAAHDRIYPLIPLCAVFAAAMLTRVGGRCGRRRRRVSIAFLVIAFVSLGLTLIASIAQLARFAFFGSLLIWVGYVAGTVLQAPRRPPAHRVDL